MKMVTIITKIVKAWRINRGIVPKENVLVVEEFNNTKLIKAIPYQVAVRILH